MHMRYRRDKKTYLPSAFQICSSFWRHRKSGLEAPRASRECHPAFGTLPSTPERGGGGGGGGERNAKQQGGETRMKRNIVNIIQYVKK